MRPGIRTSRLLYFMVAIEVKWSARIGGNGVVVKTVGQLDLILPAKLTMAFQN